MKILAEGTMPASWQQECICSGAGNSGRGCGARLLVEFADLFQTEDSDWRGTSTTYCATFQCAQCGQLTDIPKKQCPVEVTKLRRPTRKEAKSLQ